jgi:hypothetical protein
VLRTHHRVDGDVRRARDGGCPRKQSIAEEEDRKRGGRRHHYAGPHEEQLPDDDHGAAHVSTRFPRPQRVGERPPYGSEEGAYVLAHDHHTESQVLVLVADDSDDLEGDKIRLYQAPIDPLRPPVQR